MVGGRNVRTRTVGEQGPWTDRSVPVTDGFGQPTATKVPISPDSERRSPGGMGHSGSGFVVAVASTGSTHPAGLMVNAPL